MHLEEEQLERLLHRELSAREEKEARVHVAGCAACRARLADAEREEVEVHALLRALDTPAPMVRAEAVALQAEMLTGVARTGGSSWLRRAAAVAVVVGVAGAAYAIPGSPVRRWVQAVVRQVGGGLEVPSGSRNESRGGSLNVSGVAVPPGEKLSVIFTGAGRVRVSLTDDAEVRVLAPAGAATFTTKTEYVLISSRDPSATFDVGIPRTARWVEILAQDRRVFLKEGTRISTGAARAAGGYAFELSDPSSSTPRSIP